MYFVYSRSHEAHEGPVSRVIQLVGRFLGRRPASHYNIRVYSVYSRSREARHGPGCRVVQIVRVATLQFNATDQGAKRVRDSVDV